MARVIPNQNTWIGFVPWPEEIGSLCAPTEPEIAKAIDLTCFTMSINASSTGNTVPTPSLCSLFETTINGTVSATFQGDFYRDNEGDVAWDLLKRGACGYFIIKRFGGNEDSCDPNDQGTSTPPGCGDSIEVWPVKVTSRTAGALSSGSVMMFSVTAAVTSIPCEDAVACAAYGPNTGLPSEPREMTVSDSSNVGEVLATWKHPLTPNGTIVEYIIYASSDAGPYEEFTRVGDQLSAVFTGVPQGSTTFRIAARNETGTGPMSASSNRIDVTRVGDDVEITFE